MKPKKRRPQSRPRKRSRSRRPHRKNRHLQAGTLVIACVVVIGLIGERVAKGQATIVIWLLPLTLLAVAGIMALRHREERRSASPKATRPKAKPKPNRKGDSIKP